MCRGFNMTIKGAQQTFKPRDWPTITPRLVVSDALGLVNFLQSVFGATGNLRSGAPAIMQIGESRIMISDTDSRDATRAFLYVYVEDTNETYRRALKAGASSLEEPTDLPYGDRRAMVQDPWGNTWQIATRLRGDD
jgi:PhnB protein